MTSIKHSMKPETVTFYEDAIEKALGREDQTRSLHSPREFDRSHKLASVFTAAAAAQVHVTQDMIGHLPAYEQCRVYVAAIAERVGVPALSKELVAANFAMALAALMGRPAKGADKIIAALETLRAEMITPNAINPKAGPAASRLLAVPTNAYVEGVLVLPAYTSVMLGRLPTEAGRQEPITLQLKDGAWSAMLVRDDGVKEFALGDMTAEARANLRALIEVDSHRGVDAKLEHYARFGGEIQIGRHKKQVLGYADGVVTVRNADGKPEPIKLDQVASAVAFKGVFPAFPPERPAEHRTAMRGLSEALTAVDQAKEVEIAASAARVAAKVREIYGTSVGGTSRDTIMSLLWGAKQLL